MGDEEAVSLHFSATPRLSQIIQLGAQLFLNIFIYVSSLHVSGIQVPIIRRKSQYLCETGSFNPTSWPDATYPEWQI